MPSFWIIALELVPTFLLVLGVHLGGAWLRARIRRRRRG